MTLDDNSIKIVTAATLGLQAEIIGPRFSTGKLVISAHKDNLYIVNGSDIQTWHIPTERTSSSVAITARTFAGKSRGFQAKESALTACSVRGDCMATVEAWSPPQEELADLGYLQTPVECYLKFWKWSGQQWELVTRIDAPHGPHLVKEIVATARGFYTAGEDSTARYWLPNSNTWSCRRIISVFRQPQRTKIALSDDESLMAMGTSDRIYFLDPNTGSIRGATTSLRCGKVLSCGFVNTWLVVLGSKKLIVWDVLASSIHYSLVLPSTTNFCSLACGPRTFALATDDTNVHGKLFVFDPSTPKPIFREKSRRTLGLCWTDHGFAQITIDMCINYISTSMPSIPEAPVITLKTETTSLQPVTISEGISNVTNTSQISKVMDLQTSLEDQLSRLGALILGVNPTTS